MRFRHLHTHRSAGDDPPDSRYEAVHLVVCTLAEKRPVVCTGEIPIRARNRVGEWSRQIPNQINEIIDSTHYFEEYEALFLHPEALIPSKTTVDFTLSYQHVEDGIQVQVDSGEVPPQARGNWIEKAAGFLVPWGPRRSSS